MATAVVYPQTSVGQVHVIGDEGEINNYVGAQAVPLTTSRDGGPYLDDVESYKEALVRTLSAKRGVITVDHLNLPVADRAVQDVEEIAAFLSLPVTKAN